MSTVIDELVVEIRGNHASLTASIDAVQRQIGGLESKATASSRNISEGMASIVKGGAAAAAALIAVQKGIQLADEGLHKMIQSSRELQTLEQRFVALTGSTRAAGEALEFINSTAQRQSVDVLALADGYARLLPVVQSGALGMGDMRHILELVNDNIRAVGLGADETKDLFYGLSQVLGSGTVTMEDLRQVTDRLPGSLEAIASKLDGAGGTVQGLKDLIATGTVAAGTLKGPLLEALGKNAGAAEKMGATFDAASTRMDNSLRNLAATIAESTGIFAALSKTIYGIAEAAQWASDKINLMNDNFNKVKLSKLTDEAAEVKLQIQEAQSAIDDLQKSDNAANIRGHGSTLEAITGRQEEIAKLQERLKQITETMQAKLPGAADASAKALNNVANPKQVKDAKELKEKLDDLLIASQRDLDTHGMTAVQKTAYEAKVAIEDLERKYGPLTDAQKEEATQIVVNSRAHAEYEARTQQSKKSTTEYAKSLRDTKKDAAELQKGLDDLFQRARTENAVEGMDSVQRATYEAQQKVEELKRRNVDAAKTISAAWQKEADAFIQLERNKAISIEQRQQAEENAEKLAKWNEDIAAEQEKIAEQAAQPWIHAVENMQDALADFLVEGEFSFKSLADIAKKAAAEAAAAWVIKPVFGGVANAVGSALGFSGGKGAGNLISSGTGLLGNTGIGGAINGWAAKSMPSLFAANSLPWLADGGALTGVGLSASTLALGLGGIAAGFALPKIIGSFGSRPHPASTFSTQGNFDTALDLQSKHTTTEFASSLAESVKSALSALMANGINTSFIRSVQGGVDDGKGFLSLGDYSKWGADTIGFDPSNPDGGLAKFLKLVVNSAGDLSKVMDADLIPALKNLSTDGKTSAEVLNEIVAALTRDDQRTSFMSGINNSILDLILPNFSAMNEEMAQFKANLTQATALGASQAQIAQVTELHQLRVKQLQDQNNQAQQEAIQNATTLVNRYSQISGNFGSFLAELRNGKFTTLSPTANLADLRGQVMSVGANARLGDADAQEQLLTLLPQFLELSGQVNGYNAEFAKDQGIASDLAEAAKSVADRQLTVQQSILDQASKQTSLLEKLIGGSVSGGNANDKLVKALQGGYSGISNDLIDTIFKSAGVTVEPGQGRRSAFLNNPSNAGINSMLNEAFHALGVPGFAQGGWIRGGIPGRDSVPTLHMPNEYTLKAPSALSIGGQALDYMNRTGRLPANDNGDISGLRQDLQQLTSVIMAAESLSVEHLQGIRTSNARIANALDSRGW